MPLGGHPRVAAQRLDGQFARVRPSEGYGVEGLAIPGEADIAGVTVVEYPFCVVGPGRLSGPIPGLSRGSSRRELLGSDPALIL